MFTQQGIEAKPEKIQAVVEMSSPRTIKEVQRLTSSLASLNHFLSKVGDCQLSLSTFQCKPHPLNYFLCLAGKKVSSLSQSSQNRQCLLMDGAV